MCHLLSLIVALSAEKDKSTTWPQRQRSTGQLGRSWLLMEVAAFGNHRNQLSLSFTPIVYQPLNLDGGSQTCLIFFGCDGPHMAHSLLFWMELDPRLSIPIAWQKTQIPRLKQPCQKYWWFYCKCTEDDQGTTILAVFFALFLAPASPSFPWLRQNTLVSHSPDADPRPSLPVSRSQMSPVIDDATAWCRRRKMTFAKGQTDLGEPAFGLQVGTFFFFWPKKNRWDRTEFKQNIWGITGCSRELKKPKTWRPRRFPLITLWKRTFDILTSHNSILMFYLFGTGGLGERWGSKKIVWFLDAHGRPWFPW